MIIDITDGEDGLHDRQLAHHAGWRVDNDLWFCRIRRPADLDISANAPHFGFTTPNEVYVRSARYALTYDRAELPPADTTPKTAERQP